MMTTEFSPMIVCYKKITRRQVTQIFKFIEKSLLSLSLSLSPLTILYRSSVMRNQKFEAANETVRHKDTVRVYVDDQRRERERYCGVGGVL